MNDVITKIVTRAEPINPINFNSAPSEYNLNELGKHAEILADAEGLDAHRMSLYYRRNPK